jgi:hypothetical protein
LRLSQHREQWYAADQIEIGQHGHGSSSLLRRDGPVKKT